VSVGVIFLAVPADLLLVLAAFVGFCFITILRTDLRKEGSTRYKLFISSFTFLGIYALRVGIATENIKRMLKGKDRK